MKHIRLTQPGVGLVLGILLVVTISTVRAAQDLPFGKTLPGFELEIIDTSSSTGDYLGISCAKTFNWSDIQAKLIVIEFFSVFCPKCHKNTPTLNRLYKIIKDDKQLGKDIKMIAVALLDQPNQVGVFREKFKVAYPLFADPQQEITHTTRINMVPLTVVVDKEGKVIMNHAGVIEDLDAFLGELRKHYKLSQGS